MIVWVGFKIGGCSILVSGTIQLSQIGASGQATNQPWGVINLFPESKKVGTLLNGHFSPFTKGARRHEHRSGNQIQGGYLVDCRCAPLLPQHSGQGIPVLCTGRFRSSGTWAGFSPRSLQLCLSEIKGPHSFTLQLGTLRCSHSFWIWCCVGFFCC